MIHRTGGRWSSHRALVAAVFLVLCATAVHAHTARRAAVGAHAHADARDQTQQRHYFFRASTVQFIPFLEQESHVTHSAPTPTPVPGDVDTTDKAANAMSSRLDALSALADVEFEPTGTPGTTTSKPSPTYAAASTPPATPPPVSKSAAKPDNNRDYIGIASTSNNAGTTRSAIATDPSSTSGSATTSNKAAAISGTEATAASSTPVPGGADDPTDYSWRMLWQRLADGSFQLSWLALWLFLLSAAILSALTVWFFYWFCCSPKPEHVKLEDEDEVKAK